MNTITSEFTKLYFWQGYPLRIKNYEGLKLRPELYFPGWISDDTENAE